MSLVLGIDISTTATKALLLDQDGSVVASGTSTYAFDTPSPGWVEQNPDEWWRATVSAIREALTKAGVRGEAVVALGLAGQMHGAVLLDRAGSVVRPALLWNDQRTSDQCDEIRRRLSDRLIPETGNDAMTGFTAPKLLWVQQHEPAAWESVRRILLPKDFVRFKLTGSYATDLADASGTLLLDVKARSWSAPMLEALHIDRSILPDLLEGVEISGVIHGDGARLTGLAPGTPVVAGGGDQAASAIGVGAIDPDTAALSLGTSGVVFVPSAQPITEPSGRVHSFCHAVPNRWHAMGVMLSAAGSLRWFRDVVAPDWSFDDLSAAAAGVEPGAEGLFFLPYLTGERTPHNNPNARGAFVGLTVRHDRSHLARAVLEGVAFGLADGLELMRQAGLATPATLRASGGGTRSSVWCQIIADVMSAQVVTVGNAEGAALGAAILAGVGVGWFGSAQDAAERWVRTAVTAEPGSAADEYAALHRRFQQLYPALHAG